MTKSALPTIEARYIPDLRKAINAYRFTCRSCGRDEWLPAPRMAVGSKTGGDVRAVRMLTRELAGRGWYVKSLQWAECPECSVRREKTVKPEKIPAAAQPALAPASAAALTPAMRRRIADEMDAAYDTTHGRYRGNNSDQGVATALSVPRIWVEEVRSLFYGVGKGNEALAGAANDLAAFETKLGVAESEILKRLDDLRQELRAIDHRVRGA